MRNRNKLLHIFFYICKVDSTYEDQEAIGTVLNADNRNTSASNKSK